MKNVKNRVSDPLGIFTENQENLSYQVETERDEGLKKWENERIIVHRTTFKRLRAIAEKEGVDAANVWMLYCFYFDKARVDETNQPWCNDRYCMKGLGWSKKRFYPAKKVLLKHKFITQIVRKDGKKQFQGFYVKVEHMPSSVPQKQTLVNPDSGKRTHKCLNDKIQVLKQENDNVVVPSPLKNPENTPLHDGFEKRYGVKIPGNLRYSPGEVEKVIRYMLTFKEQGEEIENPLAYLQTLLKREKENPGTIPDIAAEEREQEEKETVWIQRQVREAERKAPSEEEKEFNRRHYEAYKRVVSGEAAEEQEKERRERVKSLALKKEKTIAENRERQKMAAAELIRNTGTLGMVPG